MRPIDGDALREEWLENGENEYVYDTNAVLESIDNAPTIKLYGKWIPFTQREADDEEREAYGCVFMLDCELPDEDEEILVTHRTGAVYVDTFYRDGYECYLDSGNEFVADVIAWMPLPEPYREEKKDE